MAFPISPTVGQQFVAPSGITYEWIADGAWKKVVSALTLPANAVGMLVNDGVGVLSWQEGVYALRDNTLTKPANSFGNDNESAIVSNTAGTASKIFHKRSGVWVEDATARAGDIAFAAEFDGAGALVAQVNIASITYDFIDLYTLNFTSSLASSAYTQLNNITPMNGTTVMTIIGARTISSITYQRTGSAFTTLTVHGFSQ